MAVTTLVEKGPNRSRLTSKSQGTLYRVGALADLPFHLPQILGANNMKRREVGRARAGRLEDHNDARLNHWKHAVRTVLNMGS